VLAPSGGKFVVFTCDRGRRSYDAAHTDVHTLTEVLQEIIDCRLWVELENVPISVIARCLPHLDVPRSTRRLLEIWIEERGPKARRSA
jgi:hypothetical protein